MFSLMVLLALGGTLMSGNASAKTPEPPLPSPQQLDVYVESGMKKLHVPGAAVALFSDGKITHVKGLGRADDAGTLVTPQTPFQLGSVSKSFAALIVLQLADEGRLSLDDPISKYLVSFRTSDKALSDLITIRQLLNHRSGISTLDGNRSQSTTYRGRDAMTRVAAKLKVATLRATPGEHFEYSNANYALLAHLIETVDKRSYEDAVEGRIFSRLGMKNSFVQIAKPGSLRPAVGHTQWFGHMVERDFVAGRMMAGPGGITASAEDLATYLVAVFEHDPRIIPASLSKALSKDRRGGYEFGWEFGTFGDQNLIFHGGLNPGFYSRVAYSPQTRQGVLILTNMSGSLEGNLVGGTVSYALGLPAEDIAPASVSLLRLWGTFGLTVLLLLSSALSIRNLLKTKGKASRHSAFVKMILAIVPSLALIGLGYFLAFMVPEFSGVNLTAVYMFYPDVGVLLFLSSIIAALWAVLRTWLLTTSSQLSENQGFL
ncbi:hypothetical protein ABENE_22465 [Asticcacaulis benevestitus DSM 16100 = ATCC BAA-896]|uniref:Beta-lactamase-related domain-containing protein n=2 Tax=Asticcacaulis TaxID=76890 RepID=V4NEG5_9CAUL|nr:hypothetical protein ABENE_22465 [Asticcacaulis benevestitus DSM 16100 = ATCC BAA-896]